nr:methylesterase 3-like isoform X1 [Ipomoea batatas]
MATWRDENNGEEYALSEEKYGSVKRAYVVCGEDKSLKEEYQRWLIQMNPTHEVVSGGVPPVLSLGNAKVGTGAHGRDHRVDYIALLGEVHLFWNNNIGLKLPGVQPTPHDGARILPHLEE